MSIEESVRPNGPLERLLIQVLVEESENRKTLDQDSNTDKDLEVLLKAWDEGIRNRSSSYMNALACPSVLLRNMINATITSKNFISYFQDELNFITDSINKRAHSKGINANILTASLVYEIFAFLITQRINAFCGFLPNTYKVDVHSLHALKSVSYYIWFESHVKQGWTYEEGVEYDKATKKSELLVSILEAKPRILSVFNLLSFMLGEIIDKLELDPNISQLFFIQNSDDIRDEDVKDVDIIPAVLDSSL